MSKSTGCHWLNIGCSDLALQFDVYRMSDSRLVLVLSHDVLDWLNLRQVAPLILRSKSGKPTLWLNPLVEVDGQVYVLKPELMATVPLRQLSLRVTNLSHHREDFIRALDLLFTGV